MSVHYPAIDIIVCAYNNKELTIQCVDSLLNLSYSNFRIILVDDCSTDDSVNFLRKKYPIITILENKKNLGAAKTRSNGIKISRAKYIVTIDNDATLSSDWLTIMVELMESNEKIGQASGKILSFHNPKVIAEAGGSMYFRGKAYNIGLGKLATDEKYNKIREVLYVSTASTIIRRKAFDEVGGFCDMYYHGYEDTDLSLRINIAGYKVICCPNAISYHMLSMTVNQVIGKKRAYYWIRNRLLIMFRNYEIKNLLRYLPVNLYFTVYDFFHCPKYFIPALLSCFWIIWHLPNIIIQRKKINSFRKINDSQLHQLFNLD